MHNTKGHLWGERFFSRIIKDERDFAGASTYIDENPVKANLVKEAKDWKFGGLFYKSNKHQGMFTLVDEFLAGELFFPPVFSKTAPPAVSPG
jgi:putative transposase